MVQTPPLTSSLPHLPHTLNPQPSTYFRHLQVVSLLASRFYFTLNLIQALPPNIFPNPLFLKTKPPQFPEVVLRLLKRKTSFIRAALQEALIRWFHLP